MYCDYCNIDFKPNAKGSGGMNRRFCFSCMPEGLSRQERDTLRTKLYKQKLNIYKVTKGCSVCGYNKCASALDFHHNNDEKIENIANIVNRNWKDTLTEIQKCVLLCSNCHREVHAGVISV